MTKLSRIIAIFIGFTVLFSNHVFAAPEPKFQFAVVDVERAFDQYDKKIQLEKELSDEFNRIKEWFELRAVHKLLTEAEFQEFVNLKTKPSPSDSEKQRIEELANISKQRQQELSSLQQKQNPTDQEATRLKELQEAIKKTDDSVKDEERKRETEIAQKRVQLSKQVMDDVEAAVSAVAKEKGLLLVFNKAAGEPGVVVYCNLDITDDVLKRLNKK